MKFTDFLAQAKQDHFWLSSHVFCFRSEVYPVLFFRTLWTLLREKGIVVASHLHVDQPLELKKTLTQSFLGQTSFYWLGDVLEMVKKSKKKNEPDEVEALCSYTGPHKVAFFLSSEHKFLASLEKKVVIIDIPEGLTGNQIRELFSFFEESFSPAKNKLLNELMAKVGTVPLDTACMIAHYLVVTHARFGEEFMKNLLASIAPEVSLYSLSKMFFTKQTKNFFSLWATCSEEYTVPFWTVYWGEQLWRAYHVTKFLKQSNFAAARRFSFRLPSSFLTNDWKHCSLPELEKAYKMVYDIDFAFKMGSSFCSLDLFYSSYFLGKFSSLER